MLLSDFGAYKLSGTIDLQNGRLQVLFYHDILGSELPRLGTEYPNDALETANDYFVHRWIAIVDVAHADRLIMELLTGANRRSPPFLKLKNRHILLLVFDPI